jgi:hypothetical protein
MTKPLFMSATHVALMNGLLSRSDAVKRQCAQLPRDYLVAYILTEGPRGSTVHWCMEVGPALGAVMTLGVAPRNPDVTISSRYAAMIQASQAAREGRPAANPIAVEGAPAVIAKVAAVLATARSAATVDVHFPET